MQDILYNKWRKLVKAKHDKTHSYNRTYARTIRIIIIMYALELLIYTLRILRFDGLQVFLFSIHVHMSNVLLFTPPFIFTLLLEFYEGSMTHLHNQFYPT